MTTLREAVQQALKALDMETSGKHTERAVHAMLALRAALAQEEQEPVAWMHTNGVGHRYLRFKPQDKVFKPVPLYAAPPRCPNCASLEAQNTELDRKLGELEQRRLTDEVIVNLWHKHGGLGIHEFASAIERWLKGQA